MQTQFKVRDLRKKQQFIIDDVYLNGYAKLFGPNGTAVYLSLCRRANLEQACFPSEKTIAKDHSLTDRTVRKYIGILKQANIIRIEREKNQDAKWQNNVYFLLDKSEWKKPEEIISSGASQGKTKIDPEENNDKSQRKPVPPKDAHVKEANKKEAGASPKAGAIEPMNLKQFVDWCSKSQHKHIRIIANWADTIEPDFTTKAQWDEFISRNVRAAQRLEPFEDKRLIEGLKKIRDAEKQG